MTAEQLEELLRRSESHEAGWYDAQSELILLAPSLARRVIAAEKAKAALDARINAAKEEGRIMGLGEGVECCTTVIDHNLELSIQTGAYRCKEAILAKIKEADHE